MLRYKAFILTAAITLAPLSVASPAHADLSKSEEKHGHSAFLFADKEKWNDALLHAKKTNESALVDLITYYYLLDSDSGAQFDAYVQFIEAHPSWPNIKRLKLRAEMAIKSSDVKDHDLIAWFHDSIPISGVGKIALIEAYMRNKLGDENKIIYLVRDAWRNGDFDKDQEKMIQSYYRRWLRDDDHIGRIDRLLWEGKTKSAKRIINKVPDSHQSLYQTRIALIENSSRANRLLRKVPASQLRDPGLIYDRMKYRIRRDDTTGVRQMLIMAPEHVPYPNKWWRAREYQVHKAIIEGAYSLANKLLDNHGQKNGAPMADALWLKGWILSEFLNKPEDAYRIFLTMFEQVNYPISKGRAAYWAARALERAGDKSGSNKWYRRASEYPTTFYGQLATYKIRGTRPLHLPEPPSVSSSDRSRFENDNLVKAIKLCIELGKTDMAGKLIYHLINETDDDAYARLAAELGKKMGQTHLSVRGAKKALQRNVVLTKAGYPTPPTPRSITIERPLALAIMRQESEYDNYARSPAGARGLMQLMPRTAREVARKEGVRYSLKRLYESQYNMTLGSAYLSRMVDSYDGSYVMAIAAYNAGPGNVRNWVKQFDTPGNNIDKAVNWIEKIPFAETRNYVQRVLENLQVYRHIERENSQKLQIGRDLMR